MKEIKLYVSYYTGSIDVTFEENVEYPSWWSTEVEHKISDEVKKELLNIANIHEWQNHFETAQEYAPPGEEIKPQIGYLSISDSNEKDYEYTVTADSVAGLEGF